MHHSFQSSTTSEVTNTCRKLAFYRSIYKYTFQSTNNNTTVLLTYLLTPWCRVLLEKLTGLQLVKKFPAFHPNGQYRTHKRPPPVAILGQPNPVHISTSQLLEIHLNIIHPSTPMSPQWSPSLRFPHQDSIHSPLLTHTRHKPSPSHCLWNDY